MTQGKIKKITQKGFGFIETPDGTDLFFHCSSVDGERFEELKQGQVVNFDVGRGPKGPCAERVQIAGN